MRTTASRPRGWQTIRLIRATASCAQLPRAAFDEQGNCGDARTYGRNLVQELVRHTSHLEIRRPELLRPAGAPSGLLGATLRLARQHVVERDGTAHIESGRLFRAATRCRYAAFLAAAPQANQHREALLATLRCVSALRPCLLLHGQAPEHPLDSIMAHGKINARNDARAAQ